MRLYTGFLFLVFVSILTFNGCQNTPIKSPNFGIGDKIVCDDNVGIVIADPIVYHEEWNYLIQTRNTKMYITEKQIKLFQHMDWNMKPTVAPDVMVPDVSGIPPLPGSIYEPPKPPVSKLGGRVT